MRLLLTIVFATILAAMLAVTIHASRDRSVFAVGPELLGDPWFQATLADAYFGFLTFYVWVAYRERGIWRRALWLVLILALGNIAMSVYMLLALWRWDPGEGVAALLLRGGRTKP
jgi:hypothetical protein